MKKALSVLLAVFMLCFVLGCVAYADDYSGEGSFDAADAYTVADIQALLDEGWEFVYWDQKPTCETNGLVELSYPDEFGVLSDPEPFPVAAFGHTWGELEPIVDVEATCTTEGVRHYECSCITTMVIPELDLNYKCTAKEIGDPEPIPFLQHKFYVDEATGEVVTRDEDGNLPDGAVPAAYAAVELPNCILTPNAGAKDGEVAVVCAVCGAEDPDSEHMTGYLWDWWEEDVAEAGTREEVEFIPLDPEAANYADMKAMFHEYGDWTDQVKATCTKDGYQVRYCNVCRHQDDRVVEKYNHYDGLAYRPTTQERVDCFNYIQHYKCYLCGDTTYTTKEVYENPVHRYSLEWDVTKEPTCMETGTAVRECLDCDYEDSRILPKLSHEYSDVIRTAFIATSTDLVNIAPKDHYMHWYFCENCGKELNPAVDPVAFFEGIVDGCVIPCVDENGFQHDWGEWINYTPATAGTLGHWVRTCNICASEEFPKDPNCHEREEFVGTQEEFDAMVNPPSPPHPVLKEGLVWELEDGLPVCKYYVMGMFQEDFTGIVDFEGGRFFVANGIMCSDANGLNLYKDTWYFLAGGQIQDQYTGVALYDDEFFFIEEGVLADGMTGLVDYDGETFVIVEGRIVSELNGLWHNETLWEGDGDWYFIAYGRVVKEFTGITTYDGEWFYVEDGKVILDFTGEVEYQGETFEMVDGKIVA